MIRFILKTRLVRYEELLDETRFFTIDGDLLALEEALRSGGRGPGGYESTTLEGAEVIDA